MTYRMLPALLLLPALVTPALAQSTTVALDAILPGTEAVTYFDLAQLIAPDLTQVDGRYEGIVALPAPSTVYADQPPIDGLPLSFYSASAVSFTSDGTELVALMLDSANPDSVGGSIIAVFDPTMPDRLISLADVSSDQTTSFDEQPILPLGDSDDGLLVSSSHFNSSQGYRTTALIALVDGKLTEMASVFTFNENLCGMRRQQTRAFAPILTDDDGRWAPFAITVTETTTSNDCDGEKKLRPGTRAIAATFSWAAQSGRYEPDSTALDDLYTETEARF